MLMIVLFLRVDGQTIPTFFYIFQIKIPLCSLGGVIPQDYLCVQNKI